MKIFELTKIHNKQCFKIKLILMALRDLSIKKVYKIANFLWHSTSIIFKKFKINMQKIEMWHSKSNL